MKSDASHIHKLKRIFNDPDKIIIREPEPHKPEVQEPPPYKPAIGDQYDQGRNRSSPRMD